MVDNTKLDFVPGVFPNLPEETRKAFFQEAHFLLNDDNTVGFLGYMVENRAISYGFPQLLLKEAALCTGLDRYQDHIENLRLLVEAEPSKPLILEALVCFLSRLGDMPEFNKYYAMLKERFPNRA